MHSISEWWMWLGFFIFITIMLSIDLFLLGGKKAHRVSTREALSWVILWTTLALTFNLLLWWYLNQTAGPAIANELSLAFLTGYLLEKSLSIDNMFVFVMLFNHFAVPVEYQRRILLFGVLGAIIMRLIMILVGVWLIAKFHWILYLFGVFLIVTGFKMFLAAKNKPELEKNPFFGWLKNHLRITEKFHGDKFFVKQNKLLYITPLFLVLILIEGSDLIFAIDSIPAIFAITADPFVVFTSNIFAILGLRALYFLLANMTEKFHLLKYGLAMILVFIGSKMLIAYWYPIPIFITLTVIAIILLGCMSPNLFSFLKRKKFL